MVTRCPACRSTFRVTPEQLRVRQGQVRCGKCHAVFNALQTLVYRAAPEAAREAVLQPAPEPAAAPVTEQAAAEEHAPAEFMPVDESAAPLEHERDAGGEQRAPAIEEAEDEEEEPADEAEEISPARRGRAATVLWASAALLAAIALLAQGVYVFRAELALANPAWRPQLEQWCAALGCTVAYPRHAELVSIEASDLHPDPERKPMLLLQATLKNRAVFPQAYPHLELTLTDARDQAVARRVLAPRDYLPPDARSTPALAANGEVALSMWLAAGDLPATGYRLYVFYP